MNPSKVVYGKVTKKVSSQIKMTIEVIEGYYFIYLEKNGSVTAKHIGENRWEAAKWLDGNECDKYLKHSDLWHICYCHGLDVTGRLQWAQFYSDDLILHTVEEYYI